MKEGKVRHQKKETIIVELIQLLSLHLCMLSSIWALSLFQRVSYRMMKVKRRAILVQEKSIAPVKTITKIQGLCSVLIIKLISVGLRVLKIGHALNLNSKFQSLK